jgi:hypothetical protein
LYKQFVDNNKKQKIRMGDYYNEKEENEDSIRRAQEKLEYLKWKSSSIDISKTAADKEKNHFARFQAEKELTRLQIERSKINGDQDWDR